MRSVKALLFAGLIISLLVLTIGASWLGPGHWMAAAVRPVEPPPHIPPGRENVVMTFLGPVMKNGFAGLGVANILLEKSEIRLLLAVKTDSSSAQTPNSCPLPEWARAPG